ncbi:HPP family protein [Pseudoalteromonas fenneropenaei]|uniref:HPP family protein n=1 Tax=Pseudoalteromonas fenneropenaei TaxID=1737459 RepID=A0ABV7CG10_9GAMM
MPVVFPALLAGMGATIAIGLLALLELLSPHFIWLMAPFGATTVLLFGLPDSPLAQPRNVIFGHLLTAAIGLIFLQFFPVNGLTLAIATGLSVSTMLLTKTTHPPAGANALLIMLSAPSWWFLITPVLIGAVTLVLCARIFHRCKSKLLITKKTALT